MKNGPSEICGRQPLNDMTLSNLIWSNNTFDHCSIPKICSGYNLPYFGNISTNQWIPCCHYWKDILLWEIPFSLYSGPFFQIKSGLVFVLVRFKFSKVCNIFSFSLHEFFLTIFHLLIHIFCFRILVCCIVLF